MKIICAWCQVLISDGPPDVVSHGMCAVCQARILAELDLNAGEA